MADMLQEILDEAEKKKQARSEPAPKDSDVVRVLPVYPDESGEVIAANTKTGIFRSLLNAVLPLKNDKPREIVRKIIFIASLIVAIVCFCIILSDMWVAKEHEAIYNDISDSVENYMRTGNIALPPQRVDEIRAEVPGILPQYIETYDRNNDLIGWLNISDSAGTARLDYPVLQYRYFDEEGNARGSNNYYLDHDIDHKASKFGSIYAEWRTPFTPTSRPDNVVLYGHNIGTGQMFNTVVHYYPYYNRYPRSGSIEHYLKYPVVQFNTLYEEGLYKIFAVIYVHTEERKYDDVFDYFRWREIPDRETFYTFVTNILDRSGFYTDVDLRYGDEILTLSTCYYPLTEAVDSRVVVFARRVREGESPDVDLDAAYINTSPLYFKKYHEWMGGSWAGRNWDTSKVEGLDEWLAERGEEPLHLLFTELQKEIEERNN